mmetsp:Transcript_9327/g.14280  ORF Transcript_9327/g.14280 Transcript_9327/m.14280 type:complete len:84 (-) Transcript_9327:419-670(-)
MIHRLLRGKNMTPRPRVCDMFFNVQAALLYGSETWVLTDSAMRCLEGFYYRAVCPMARENRPTKENGLIQLGRLFLKRLSCTL